MEGGASGGGAPAPGAATSARLSGHKRTQWLDEAPTTTAGSPTLRAGGRLHGAAPTALLAAAPSVPPPFLAVARTGDLPSARPAAGSNRTQWLDAPSDAGGPTLRAGGRRRDAAVAPPPPSLAAASPPPLLAALACAGPLPADGSDWERSERQRAALKRMLEQSGERRGAPESRSSLCSPVPVALAAGGVGAGAALVVIGGVAAQARALGPPAPVAAPAVDTTATTARDLSLLPSPAAAHAALPSESPAGPHAAAAVAVAAAAAVTTTTTMPPGPRV